MTSHPCGNYIRLTVVQTVDKKSVTLFTPTYKYRIACRISIVAYIKKKNNGFH